MTLENVEMVLSGRVEPPTMSQRSGRLFASVRLRALSVVRYTIVIACPSVTERKGRVCHACLGHTWKQILDGDETT